MDGYRKGGHIMMFWYGHDMGGWGYAGMAIGMVLFWALIIVGIVALVRYAGVDQTPRYLPPGSLPPGSIPPANQYDAEQMLAVRFARGEIDESEYRHRLTVLRDHAGF